MKKTLIGMVLLLGALQMPVSAINYSTWSGLNSAFIAGDFNMLPFGLANSITAPVGSGDLSNWSGYATFDLYGYNLTGGGGANATIWNNELASISIYGGTISSIRSDAPAPTIQTIGNWGTLTLGGVTLDNGVGQSYSGANLDIGYTDGGGGTTTLSGNNSITGGKVGLVGTRNTMVFDGGTIGAGALLSVGGSMNQLIIQNGSVTLNDPADYWISGGQISLTNNGVLILDNYTHNTISTGNQGGNNCYVQTGGTLNLTNSSNLTLNDGSGSYIRGGGVNISGASTLNIENGVNNNAVIATSGSGNTLSVGNFNSTATTLTLNSGSDIQSGTTVNIGASGGTNIGNNVNVESGATIESGASVNIYGGNNLNVAGGNVTLDNTGTWAGNVNVTSGTLNLNGGSYDDFSNPLNQTGGTLNLENATSFTSQNANTITTHGSSTTTVNIGTSTGVDGSSLTLVGNGNLQPANSTSNLVVNVGSATSTGNSLNVNQGGTLAAATQVIINQNNSLNVGGGSATLNGSGTGTDTWSGNVNLSAGRLNLNNFTKDTLGGGSYTQSGGVLNLTNSSALTLHSGDSITMGTINIGTSSLDTGNSLNISGTTISPSGLSININNGGQLNLSSGSISSNATIATNTGGSFNISGGSASLDSLNIYGWLGAVNLTGTGTLTGSYYNEAQQLVPQGTYTQTGANTNLNLNTNSVFTLGSGSSINSGNVTADGTSCLFVEGGTVAEAAVLNLPSGSGVKLLGGNLTLNGTTGSYTADTWDNGSMFIMSGGNLTLDNFTRNASGNIAHQQTGGTLNLTNGSDLTISGSNYIGTNGSGSGTTTVNIGTSIGTDGSSLTLGSGSSIGAATNGDTLTVNVGSATSTGNSLNVTGGTLAQSAVINLNANNDLNISGGTVTLNQAGIGIDTLIGAVNLSGGDLYADSISSYGTFNQTGGNLYIDNPSSTSAIATGEHHFHGGTMNLRRGDLIIKSPDTWTATNFNVAGGTLTLNDFSHDATTLGSGKINQTAGTTQLLNGSVLTIDDNSHFTGGNLVINGSNSHGASTLNLTTTAGTTIGASLSGNGNIYKNGVGTLLLSGRNSAFDGAMVINAGNVNYSNAEAFMSGVTRLNGGNLSLSYGSNAEMGTDIELTDHSTLTMNTNGYNVLSGTDCITSTAGQNNTLIKDGNGSLTFDARTNPNINYSLQVNQGSVNLVSNNLNFNDNVTVGQGPGNPSASLNITAQNTTFNHDLTLSNAYMNMLNGGFNVNGNMSVGSTINTMNGMIATNNITHNFNIGPSGSANFAIDVSPSTGTSDTYHVGGDVTTTHPGGVINISNINLVGPVTANPHINLNVFGASATSTVDPTIVFKAADSIYTSPYAQYMLSSLGNGGYSLNFVDYNPQAFRGQVATEAAYANQLTTNDIIFNHINLVSQQILSSEKPNVYANENPLFAPYQYNKQGGSLWYRAFGNIERLQLSQNINTQNNMWGSIIGADFPLVDLNKGWKFLPTAYVAYTGGYQTYNSVDMYQNGGQGGFMGTFYKGNFIESLLAYAGGYGNNMSVGGTRDDAGNWFAGVASKSAYNIALPKDFILQPTFLINYNAFGQQNWNSSFGGTSMTSNMLNGLNVAPGLNLILNKETWSVYATTQWMFNIMNGVSGSINDIPLPTVKMGTSYFQYGVGFTKRFKDRLSVYGQILFSNGVRTGVGFQGGLEWKF